MRFIRLNPFLTYLIMDEEGIYQKRILRLNPFLSSGCNLKKIRLPLNKIIVLFV